MAQIIGNGSGYLRQRRKVFGLTMLVAFVVMEGLIFSLQLFRPLPSTLALIGILFFLGLIAYVADTLRTAEKKFFNFDDGMFGEHRVVKLLQSLPDQYVVFRNCRVQANNDIDLVIVGPTGIYAVEVKSHVGKIGFDGEHLTHNGRPFPEKDPIAQVLSEAMSLRQYLKDRTGRDYYVQPVIVFSSNHISLRLGMKKYRNAFVIQRQWLTNLLTTNPQRPTVGFDDVHQALTALVHPASVEAQPAEV